VATRLRRTTSGSRTTEDVLRAVAAIPELGWTLVVTTAHLTC